MAKQKYKVLSPVIQAGVIVDSGEIDLDDKYGAKLVEKGVLEEVASAKKTDSANKAEADSTNKTE
ncbi:hypothetical protein QYF52_25825 [Paenibacillus polymyxa]|uniref:hypothetical protein n=1 Tax=Paenibacillus polymyxa TaxID=1406 RepID=UPI0025B677FB|nr:hypothetical protein [Paenibacillus polymyxa]MDN4081336.1 hypothetical protein [Paenibacillus polymyxa]MDN4085963.1 hypothetical protein [Paenibacillus polymyxa]MDN4111865.1 hypothetical protein [Paenibacillus polymyxa]